MKKSTTIFILAATLLVIGYFYMKKKNSDSDKKETKDDKSDKETESSENTGAGSVATERSLPTSETTVNSIPSMIVPKPQPTSSNATIKPTVTTQTSQTTTTKPTLSTSFKPTLSTVLRFDGEKHRKTKRRGFTDQAISE